MKDFKKSHIQLNEYGKKITNGLTEEQEQKVLELAEQLLLGAITYEEAESQLANFIKNEGE
jgi:hypothetical protein